MPAYRPAPHAFARRRSRGGYEFAFACVAVVGLLTRGAVASPPHDGAVSDDDSLRAYIVTINQNPPQSWTGNGVYLGRGLIITADHVVGSKPSVRMAQLELVTKVIKESPFGKDDLALLSIDEQEIPLELRKQPMSLCEKSPSVGQAVIVATPDGTARSRILSPIWLPTKVRTRFSTVIEDVATTGNSGSGVFDADRHCLLGIMSRKIQVGQGPEIKPIGIAKYFVPVTTIRAFMPEEYRSLVDPQKE